MDDTQGVSQLEVQGLNAVGVLGGPTAPVAGTHEAPHAGTGVQHMPDVLLRAVCGTRRRGQDRGLAVQQRGYTGVRWGSGSTAEESCRGPMAVGQHSQRVM